MKKIAYMTVALVIALICAIMMTGCSTEDICKVEDCKKEKVNGFYCATHACDVDGCVTRVMEDTGNRPLAYCSRHLCGSWLLYGCEREVMEGYSFCEKHKCANEDCNVEAGYDGYCKHHAPD